MINPIDSIFLQAAGPAPQPGPPARPHDGAAVGARWARWARRAAGSAVAGAAHVAHAPRAAGPGELSWGVWL